MGTIKLIKKYQFGQPIESMKKLTQQIVKELIARQPKVIQGTIDRMQAQYGTPYFLGNRKGYTDCSQFVGSNLYRAAFGDDSYANYQIAGFEGEGERDPNRPFGNTAIMKTALEQMVKDGNAITVTAQEARPGDIVLWPRNGVGHVGYVVDYTTNENGETYPIIANASGYDAGAGKAESLYFDTGERATELNKRIGYKHPKSMISPKVTFYRLDYSSGGVGLFNQYIESAITGKSRLIEGSPSVKLPPIVVTTQRH